MNSFTKFNQRWVSRWSKKWTKCGQHSLRTPPECVWEPLCRLGQIFCEYARSFVKKVITLRRFLCWLILYFHCQNVYLVYLLDYSGWVSVTWAGCWWVIDLFSSCMLFIKVTSTLHKKFHGQKQKVNKQLPELSKLPVKS